MTITIALVPHRATAQNLRKTWPRGSAQRCAPGGLDRAGFSPGELDGKNGPKTRLALAEFQKHAGAAGGLTPPAQPLIDYTITAEDVAGPFIDKMPSDMMESAKLPGLGYVSPLEKLAEKFHSSQALLQTLNPSAKGHRRALKVRTSAVELRREDKPARKQSTREPARAAIESSFRRDKSLTVRDTTGRGLMYAPITVGSTKDPLPTGEWKVTSVSWNPTFNYNPDLFWDADPAHAKAKIPAGPNNPVGVVWIDINKEHFGLHGTPEPSTIGRTESHGCIRLSNWDATKLGRLVSAGTKVTIQ